MSSLAIAAMQPQRRCVLWGGVSACHILRHRFPQVFGNLLLKQWSSGAYMPGRFWPEGSVASSTLLLHPWLWASERNGREGVIIFKRHFCGQNPVLMPVWFRFCFPISGEGEELLLTARGTIFLLRAPLSVSLHTPLLGHKGVEGSTHTPMAELPQCGSCVIQT